MTIRPAPCWTHRSAIHARAARVIHHPAAKANTDGSTTAPRQPAGVKRGNWMIQTDPKKGWFAILGLYGPLRPFFDKSSLAGEIELMK